MPDRTFRQRVLARETVLGTFLNTGSPVAAEICARAGFDWMLIDLEHGAGSEADLLAHLHAVAGTRAVPIVRVERGERLRIARALDLGAAGIMVPRLETSDEAAEVVGYLRYPPTGLRGVALMTRGADYAGVGHADVASVNEAVLGVMQVESPAAVAEAARIAAVDGVDVLFVGPTDLTHAMGIPGGIDRPEYDAAVRVVGQAARRAGKAAGVLLWRPSDLERYIDAGYTFFAISSDGAILNDGARALVEALREGSSAS